MPFSAHSTVPYYTTLTVCTPTHCIHSPTKAMHVHTNTLLPPYKLSFLPSPYLSSFTTLCPSFTFSLSLSLSLSLASLFYSFCPSLPPSFSPSLSLAVDNVQLLDETIQHNLLLGMRPKSTPHHQKFDPGKVSRSVSLSTIHVRVHHLGHQTVVPHVDVGRPRCVPLHL